MLTIPEPLRGACTRARAEAVIGRRAVTSLLATGRLRVLWSGILVPRDLVLDPITRATAALLAAGTDAALTGLTAAWLQGCSAATTPVVHVVVPYSRWVRGGDGFVVHHGRRQLEDVVTVHGLRALPLDAAVTELLCSDQPRRALAVADQAAGLLPEASRPAFRARIVDRLAVRADRRGTARAAALLELVTGDADSPPESWLKLLVVEAGYPQPTTQFKIFDLHGRLRYILDLCWPQLRIALEYDGYEAHEHREVDDAWRDDDLARRGWLTIRATAEDLRRPARLLAELAEAFRSRGVSAC
ncbi:MAG: DUF559 domain-containing protein [Pseudonocardiaceae bacterium]